MVLKMHFLLVKILTKRVQSTEDSNAVPTPTDVKNKSQVSTPEELVERLKFST